jgi:hypothetical protein
MSIFKRGTVKPATDPVDLSWMKVVNAEMGVKEVPRLWQ